MIDTSKISDAEKQAEIATLQRELAIIKNQMKSLQGNNERLEADNEDLSQKLLIKAKRDGESTILMDRLNNLRGQLRDAERSREQARADAAELRTVMQQYVDQIQTIDTAVDPQKHEALLQELEMVREQSRRDLKDLQDQLEQQSDNSRDLNSDNVIEIEVLRQEHEAINRTLSDRETELQISQQTCQLLEDELEDAHTEIDELRRQLEQVSVSTGEKVAVEPETGKPMDVAAVILAENISDQQDLKQSVPVLDIRASNAGLFSKHSLASILLGVAIALGGLEAITFASGKGEFFQLLLNRVDAESTADAGVAVLKTPDHSSGEHLSGQIARD